MGKVVKGQGDTSDPTNHQQGHNFNKGDLIMTMTYVYGDQTVDLVLSSDQYFFTDNNFPPKSGTDIPFDPELINFFNQILSGSSSASAYTVYGDLRDIMMNVAAPSINSGPQGVYANTISDYTINMGSDYLKYGNQNNFLYGDMRDLHMDSVGGVTNGGYINEALIVNNTINYGNDVIRAGNGDNSVFGDARDFDLSAVGGTNLDASYAPTPDNILSPGHGQLGATEMNTGNAFNFGCDKILLGNGDNQIYSDVRDISMIAIAGTAVSNGFNNLLQNSMFAFDSFNFGNDTIQAGNGDNKVCGDFNNWSMIAGGGQITGATGTDLVFDAETLADMSANTAVMGNDTIKLGNGDNYVYGDGTSFLGQVTAGVGLGGTAAEATLGQASTPNTFTFGADSICVGNGQNHIYGDLGSVDLEVNGINQQADFNQAAVGVSAQIRRTNFVFGDDTINAGNGDNTVYGDTGDVTWHAQAYANEITWLVINRLISVNRESMLFGNDTINCGNGNDLISGDANNIRLEADGGHATSESSAAQVSGANGTGNTMRFGADTIHAGGGNDVVAGDAFDISMIGRGGLVDGNVLPNPPSGSPDTHLSAWGQVNNVLMTMGADKIYGGAGSDIIYGDVHSLSLQALGGTVTASGIGGDATGQVANNTITFGNDLISGGSGNDVIYGDTQSVSLIAQNGTDAGVGNALALMTGNSITLGDNTLFGAAGDDVLVGGVGALTGLNAFQANNAFNFGHNQFVYDGCINNGHDKILDFHEGMDTLVGQNGATFHDGGHNGAGDLVIKVWDAAGHNSSNITLVGVHDTLAHLASVAGDINLVAHPIVVA
jgi:hypothetical protein